jgi:hypothetical protein
MTLSIMTLCIMTLSIMTLNIMTLSIMTLSIMALSIMTLSIMTLSIITLSLLTLSIKLHACFHALASIVAELATPVIYTRKLFITLTTDKRLSFFLLSLLSLTMAKVTIFK